MDESILLFGRSSASDLRMVSWPEYSVVERVVDVSPFAAVQADGTKTWVDKCDWTTWSRTAKIDAGMTWAKIAATCKADYLVIDLSGALMALFIVPCSEPLGESRVFSTTWGAPHSLGDLLHKSVSLGHAKIITPGIDRIPPGTLKLLRTNFKQFTATISASFASDHIILVRNDVHLFYWDGKRVAPRQRGPELVRARFVLREVEDFFARETGCCEVAIAERWIPDRDREIWDTSISEDYLYRLQYEVGRCLSLHAPAPASRRADRCSCTAQAVYMEAQRDSNTVRSNTAAVQPPPCICANDDSVKCGPETLFALASRIPSDLTKVAISTPLPDVGPSRLPIGAADFDFLELVARNVMRLKEYKYNLISERLLDRALALARSTHLPQTALSLSGDTVLWFGLDASGIHIKRLDFASHPRQDDAFPVPTYSFRLGALSTVLGSWQLYFHFARHQLVLPLVLSLANLDELLVALFAFDWEEILRSENIVTRMSESGWNRFTKFDWSPRTDLRVLFQDGSFIACLRSGFGDQFQYYTLARILTSQCQSSRRFPIIDDLLYDDDPHTVFTPHCRFGLNGVMGAPEPPRMSHLVSPRLRWARRKARQSWPRDDRSEYFALGLHESIYVTHHRRLTFIMQQQHMVAGPMLVCSDFRQLTAWFGSRWAQIPVIDVLAPTLPDFSSSALSNKLDYERSMQPPKALIRANSVAVAQEMQRCEGVVLHVRRGDRVALGSASPPQEYQAALANLIADIRTPSASDLDLFVFSDDMPYVQLHASEIGITLLEPGHVHFVTGFGDPLTEWNLMRLGKYILTTNSGFVTSAALASPDVQGIFGFSEVLNGTPWFRTEAQLAGSSPAARQADHKPRLPWPSPTAILRLAAHRIHWSMKHIIKTATNRLTTLLGAASTLG